MRVNFLNPVQSVIASASHVGTTALAKKTAEEHESKEEQRHIERMNLESSKIGLRERYLESYEKQVEGQLIRARTEEREADERIKVSKQNRRIINKQMKMQDARNALDSASFDEDNARNAVQNMKEIHMPIEGWTGTQEDE